ncbi:recombinase family protein [Neobacillus cucumis]|uniref:Recombinase domain-containing protein n=1 Tax=Neobacillus cucumis TaxID=1740721 RepID=A0A2N5HBJ9_9BACI|nr:recombinase family protein [Neobacillus cucumis]PLS02896.1 hypothetical protein CVD27_17075 [Neobacillus cucumis]
MKKEFLLGGSPPLGYQIVKNAGKSELAISDEEAEVVRLIFDLAGNHGFGCSRISQELNHRGIPTRNGKQWISSTITRILRNPIYIGYPAYNKSSRLLGKLKYSEWKL